jgi:hypothetical protein
VTKRPAASKNDQLFGTGYRFSSCAQTSVAYPPWEAPKTRSPGLYRGFRVRRGVLTMVPLNSEPDIPGSGGREVSLGVGGRKGV